MATITVHSLPMTPRGRANKPWQRVHNKIKAKPPAPPCHPPPPTSPKGDHSARMDPLNTTINCGSSLTLFTLFLRHQTCQFNRVFEQVWIVMQEHLINLKQISLLNLVLGFNDTLTLVGHFVSSPRDEEKKDRRDSRGDENDGQWRKEKWMKVKKQKK